MANYHILLLLTLFVLRVQSQCTYNLTHCSCSPGVGTGKCLRDLGGGMCNVDSCSPGGLVCDCGGSSMCEVYSCNAMVATDGSPNSDFAFGDSVSCSGGSTYCLSATSVINISPTATPSLGASPSVSSSISSSSSAAPTNAMTTISPTSSVTVNVLPSESTSAAPTPSGTLIPSSSPSNSQSAFPSSSSSSSASQTPSPSSSVTPSASQTVIPTTATSFIPSPSASTAPSVSSSSAPSNSATSTTSVTPTSTAPLSSSPTPVASSTPAPSASSTPSPSTTSSTSSIPSQSTSSTPSISASFSTTPSPSNSPFLTYRMVQFGDDESLDHTFNMSQFFDNGNSLRNAAGINGQWGDGFTERRVITFRIYDNAPASGEAVERMICAIYNPNIGTFDDASDPFPIQVDVKVTGLSGQTVSWIFCDELGECQGTAGNVIYGSHDTTSNLSDGFCVGDFEESGNVIAFDFSNVFGIKSIAFEDPSGIVKQYDYKDMGLPQAGGLVGAWVDLDDRVHFGIAPTIKFNWQGFGIPI